jgi:DHA1 family bicyclomycin/chloramphenicol resistance-like MFS transporter
MLGFVTWVAAGAIAPIAGLGGPDTAVPMALLMIACTVLSVAGLVLARPSKAASTASN